MSMITTTTTPKGYRRLRAGEKLNRGDKFFDYDRWIVTAWPAGTKLTRRMIKANGCYIRRES